MLPSCPTFPVSIRTSDYPERAIMGTVPGNRLTDAEGYPRHLQLPIIDPSGCLSSISSLHSGVPSAAKG